MKPFTISDEKLELLLARELEFSELEQLKRDCDRYTQEILNEPECPFPYPEKGQRDLNKEKRREWLNSDTWKEYEERKNEYFYSPEYEIVRKIDWVFWEQTTERQWVKKVADYAHTLSLDGIHLNQPELRVDAKEFANYPPLRKIATQIAANTYGLIEEEQYMDVTIDSNVMPILSLALIKSNEVMEKIVDKASGWWFGNEYHYIGFNWLTNELAPEILIALFRIGPFGEQEINKAKASYMAYGRINEWENITFKSLIDDGSSDEIHYFSDTSYYGIELRSPGHKKICERLEEMGVMFFFESPCKLYGDKKKYRRIDLIVVHNDRAVIVEVDGGTHRTVAQQRDDYERDFLIRKNWSKTLRVEHSDAFERTEEVIARIMSELDPTSGSIK